jgi:predicted TIM-barrel fold metal-dependent hydrolase
VLAVMRGDSKFYVETTFLLAPFALEAVRDQVPHGAERLVFASYSPLRYLSSALAPVLASTLSDEDKALILGGNLRRLLTKQ